MRSVVRNNESLDISCERLLEWSDKADENVVLIHRGRNQIWLIDKESDKAVAVKSFSKALKSRLIYAFRKSKARRSFENALILLSRGVATPQPYGYIEKHGMLNTLIASEYICEYEDSLSLYDAIVRYGRECLGAFAEFVARLHRNGIRHDDLNNSNVRVSLHGNNFTFSLIDLNRMKIYKPDETVPEKECFENLCKFCSLDNDYIYFVRKYIEARNMSEHIYGKIIDVKRKHDKGVERKRRLKKFFRKLIP